MDDQRDFLPEREPLSRLDRNWGNILTWVIAATTVGVIFSAGGLWLASRPVPRGIEVMIPSADTSGPATVHVLGGVENPGVFTLPPGSRVLDAIESAGGLVDPSKSGNLNLAQLIVDGQQIVISEGNIPSANGLVVSTRDQDGRINLNSADSALLEELPGIGEVRAKSIVEWRLANGPFTSADDLLAISGIGISTVNSIRPLVYP
ncbi:MAG: ComEA family DNA-binding protein [Chloroflexi bacterium]|nr:ComEA family DNA-binding protein [Chloroflexota bacterium]